MISSTVQIETSMLSVCAAGSYAVEHLLTATLGGCQAYPLRYLPDRRGGGVRQLTSSSRRTALMDGRITTSRRSRYPDAAVSPRTACYEYGGNRNQRGPRFIEMPSVPSVPGRTRRHRVAFIGPPALRSFPLPWSANPPAVRRDILSEPPASCRGSGDGIGRTPIPVVAPTRSSLGTPSRSASSPGEQIEAGDIRELV